MRKLILSIFMVLVCGVARAELNIGEVLQSIPNLKQGVAYSVLDSKVNYLATFDIYSKYGVSLEAGYAGVAKNSGDKLVAVLSYDLLNLKNMGVTIPVLDLIAFRPGVYAGTGRLFGGDEFDWGVSATVLEVKW